METGDRGREQARQQLSTLQADAVAAGERSTAPLWYLVMQALCCAGFVLSFGFGPWQALGSAWPAGLLAAAVVLTFAVVLLLGIRMERALARSIRDGA